VLDAARLDQLLACFGDRSIALVGDLFLDRYLQIDGAIEEDSIETGLPVHHVEQIRNSPGALGTVLNNLHALGAGRLVPITVIGDDGHGYDLLAELERINVETEHVIRSPSRMTPTYTKPLKQDENGHWIELNRIDSFTRAPLDSSSCDEIARRLQQVLPTVDGLIVLDQLNTPELGVVNETIRQLLHSLPPQPGRPILVDSRTNLHAFQCGIMKGNQVEIRAAWQQISGADLPISAAILALSQHSSQPVFCTRGEFGAAVATPDGKIEDLPGQSVSGPVDIVGAGDSATSGFFLALTSAATLAEAAMIANLVASVTVQKLGTTGTASPAEVRQALSGN